MEFKDIFARQIKENKKTRHLNQRELGELFGVSRCTINYWLCGRAKPSIESIENMAKILDIPVSELLGKESYDDLSELDKAIISLTKEQKALVVKFFRLINQNQDFRNNLVSLINSSSETLK